MNNKFDVKVKFVHEKNAEQLIKAFFRNYNPESCIEIKGKEAKAEIVFQEAPMEIVDAICCCEIVELTCNQNLEKYVKEKSVQEKSKKEEAVEKVTEKLTVEPAKKRRGRSPKNPNKEMKKEPKKIIIPELEKLAKQAKSFEDFAMLVAEWLEMDKRKEFFVNLALISSEIKGLSWQAVETAMNEQGKPVKQWDKIWTSKQVSEKLKECSVTIMKLLKAIGQYKDYGFSKVEQNSNEEKSAQQALEDIFVSVDKTKSIEERVRYVLDKMDIGKASLDDKKMMISIGCIAVQKQKMDLDEIFQEAHVTEDEAMTARMMFSTFINDFMQKFESNKKMKLLAFLLEMQKFIMADDEMEL